MRKHFQLSFIDLTAKSLIPEDDPLKILFESIDFSFLHDHKYKPRGAHGYNPVSLLKAILLIYLGLANSERDLAFKLKYNIRFSFLCGFNIGHTPSHATFHYFRERIGLETFSQILSILIAQAVAIIKMKNLSVSIDSTHIQQQFKTDKDATWGAKSKEFIFFGHKVHVVVSNTGPPIPLSVEITPANTHDGKMFKPLVAKAKDTTGDEYRISETCADVAYDSIENHSFALEINAMPIIAKNKRNKKNAIHRGDMFITEDDRIICKGGRELLNRGYDKRRKRYKFRCPLVKGEGVCIFRSICWKSKYGPVFLFDLKEEQVVIDRVRVIRSSKRFKESYKKRTHVERFFSVLKERHILGMLRFKGKWRVSIPVYLSMIAYVLRAIAGMEMGVGLLSV